MSSLVTFRCQSNIRDTLTVDLPKPSEDWWSFLIDIEMEHADEESAVLLHVVDAIRLIFVLSRGILVVWSHTTARFFSRLLGSVL